MKIEIWSDVVCPWCYIGKRRLERALRDFDAADHADAVRADSDEARALGANGVPFFVIDRKYGISGAQSAEVFLRALQQAQAGSG